VVGSRVATGTPCVEQSPVNLCSGEVESERGRTVEASVGFIGAGVGTGLAWRGAVRAGSSAGACSGAPERVEHVGVCFYLCSNVCRDCKRANLAMSLAQISSWHLGPAIMCESQWKICPGRYALVNKICERQIGVVTLFTPRQKGCQIMSNGFGLGSNVSSGFLR
jgi:hypothetical protein